MSVIDSQLQVSGESFQHNAAAMRAVIDDLRRSLAQTARGGSDAARAKHIARGKLLVRERIDALLDPGSPLLEIAPWPPMACTTIRSRARAWWPASAACPAWNA